MIGSTTRKVNNQFFNKERLERVLFFWLILVLGEENGGSVHLTVRHLLLTGAKLSFVVKFLSVQCFLNTGNFL